VRLLWDELRAAVPLIWHGDPHLLSVIAFTAQVAAVATAIATVIGLPIGLVLGLGRFPGSRTLRYLANASVALPPVLVGLLLWLTFAPLGPLGGLQLNITRRAVIIAQTILALPYTVALTSAAVQGLPPGLLRQARAFGAGRTQLATLALREARIGVVAAIIAALGTTLSEVGAIVIVGGNVYGYDQTLASSALYDANAARYAEAIATGIVLGAMILILLGGLSVLQERSGGFRWRFRTIAATT
jgi:tungstate transport system permease protein